MEVAKHSAYPAGARVRVSDICGNRRSGKLGLLPINKATWYAWIKKGRVRPGQKIGVHTVVWPVEYVLSFGQAGQDESTSSATAGSAPLAGTAERTSSAVHGPEDGPVRHARHTAMVPA